MASRDLSVDFLGVHFQNPFCLSSSPVGNCYGMCAKAYETGWGGVVYKTLHTDDFKVNEVPPTLRRAHQGVHAVRGLQEHGADRRTPARERPCGHTVPQGRVPDGVLIASLMGQDEGEWEELARTAEAAGADMVEMNLSSPQMTSHAMGSDVGVNPDLCRRYAAAVKRGTSLPVLAKTTPTSPTCARWPRPPSRAGRTASWLSTP